MPPTKSNDTVYSIESPWVACAAGRKYRSRGGFLTASPSCQSPTRRARAGAKRNPLSLPRPSLSQFSKGADAPISSIMFSTAFMAYSDGTNMSPDPQHSPSARRLLSGRCRAQGNHGVVDDRYRRMGSRWNCTGCHIGGFTLPYS